MDNVQTLAGLGILGRVARMTAQYETPLDVPVSRSLVMVACRETVKESYLAEGRPDLYKDDMVYYLTDDQFGYAAALDGIMMRERPATIFLQGLSTPSRWCWRRTATACGAIQIAGTAEPSQLPFFVAACDYTLIGRRALPGRRLSLARAPAAREPEGAGHGEGGHSRPAPGRDPRPDQRALRFLQALHRAVGYGRYGEPSAAVALCLAGAGCHARSRNRIRSRNLAPGRHPVLPALRGPPRSDRVALDPARGSPFTRNGSTDPCLASCHARRCTPSREAPNPLTERGRGAWGSYHVLSGGIPLDEARPQFMIVADPRELRTHSLTQSRCTCPDRYRWRRRSVPCEGLKQPRALPPLLGALAAWEMRHDLMFSLSLSLSLLLLIILTAPHFALAGPNAGGTLVVHNPDLLMSNTNGSVSLCSHGMVPSACSEITTRLRPLAKRT